MKKNFLLLYWDTILELADSKKVLIFILGMVALASADHIGFPGVRSVYRLAAAVFLMAVWLVCQSAVDIFSEKEVENTKIVVKKPVEQSNEKIAE